MEEKKAQILSLPIFNMKYTFDLVIEENIDGIDQYEKSGFVNHCKVFNYNDIWEIESYRNAHCQSICELWNVNECLYTFFCATISDELKCVEMFTNIIKNLTCVEVELEEFLTKDQ